MRKTKYEKPVADVLLFDLEDVRMLTLESSNDGEDPFNGHGDDTGEPAQQ